MRTLEPYSGHATGPGKCCIDAIFKELICLIKDNPGKNSVIVPVLQTFNVMLEGDTCLPLLSGKQDEGETMCVLLKSYLSNPRTEDWASIKAILDFAITNIEKIKSIQRVEECMRMYVGDYDDVHLTHLRALIEPSIYYHIPPRNFVGLR